MNFVRTKVFSVLLADPSYHLQKNRVYEPVRRFYFQVDK